MSNDAKLVAGVRLKRNSPMLWVSARDAALAAGDHVTVEVDGEEHDATVAVAPGQMLNPTRAQTTGTITGARAEDS